MAELDQGHVIAAIGAGIALLAGLAAWQAALKGLLQQQLTAYLDAYLRISADFGVPDTSAKFRELPPHQQRAVEVLAGQLVGVVDLMKDTCDRRHSKWSTFLVGFPGALVRADGWELEDYARHGSTIASIRKARRAAS